MLNLMNALIDRDLEHLNNDFYQNVFQVPSPVVEKIKLVVYVSEQMQMDDTQILMDQPSLQPIDTYHIEMAFDPLTNATLRKNDYQEFVNIEEKKSFPTGKSRIGTMRWLIP